MPKKIKGFDEWEVKNAASMLAEAEKIKNNLKLLKAVQSIAKENAVAARETVIAIGQALKQKSSAAKKQAANQRQAKKIFGK